MTKGTAVVTGARGFIGAHLVDALIAAKWRVIEYDLKVGFDIRVGTFADADVCFHLAAQTNAHSDAAHDDASHNIMGTLRVLDYYGEKTIFATTVAAFTPTIPYAISKLACDHYCRLYGARLVRMVNISGPGGHGVFEKFAAAETLKIAGKGDQLRAYAPVRRAVETFMAAIDEPPGTELFVPGPELTVMDIADLLYPRKPREFVEQKKTDLADIR
jgi:nucleoside-diphosphate-sugar epimerase